MNTQIETISGHTKAFYRGTMGKSFQGEELPGPELKDPTGIIPPQILAKINKLSVKERQRLVAELR